MRSVLLVEDSESLRSLISRVLHLAGCDVQLAVDGGEALRLWNTHSFDLVITDIVMPNSDGLQLICEIRRQQADVKIIAISGGGYMKSSHYLDLAQKFGADYCLLKPFTVGEILETVELALPIKQPPIAASFKQATSVMS